MYLMNPVTHETKLSYFWLIDCNLFVLIDWLVASNIFFVVNPVTLETKLIDLGSAVYSLEDNSIPFDGK